MRPDPRPRPFLWPALERVWLSERRPRPVEKARAWLGARILPQPARDVCVAALEGTADVQDYLADVTRASRLEDPQDQARRIVEWAQAHGVPVQLVPADPIPAGWECAGGRGCTCSQ